MGVTNHITEIFVVFFLIVLVCASSFPTNKISTMIDADGHHVIQSCTRPADFKNDVNFTSTKLQSTGNSPFCTSFYDSLNCSGDPSVVFISPERRIFTNEDVDLAGSIGSCKIPVDSNCPSKLTEASQTNLTIQGNFRQLGPYSEIFTLQPGNCTSVSSFFRTSRPFLYYQPSSSSDDNFCVKAFFSDSCTGPHIQMNAKSIVMDSSPFSIGSFGVCEFDCPQQISDLHFSEAVEPELEPKHPFVWRDDENEDGNSSEEDEADEEIPTNSEVSGDDNDDEGNSQEDIEDDDDGTIENEVDESEEINEPRQGGDIEDDDDNEVEEKNDIDESKENGETKEEVYHLNGVEEEDRLSSESSETDETSDEAEGQEKDVNFDKLFMVIGWIAAIVVLGCLVCTCKEIEKEKKRKRREVKLAVPYRRGKGLLVPVLYYKKKSPQ